MSEKNESLTVIEPLENKIFLIRGQKVMLDADLAEIYSAETEALNRAVKRNITRFPEDFMFQLTIEEIELMRCQFGTASASKRNVRFRPYVFTEHGAVMLASVLNSPQAITASLQVVRAFVRLRTILAGHKELAANIVVLEKKMGGKFAEQVEKILSILKIIKQSIEAPATNKRQIGYISAKENG